MRSLEARVKRLEKKRRIADTPSRREYDDASFRSIGRYAYSAKLKLFRIAGQDEDDLWEFLSERERRRLEKDTPEQQAKDRDVIERYRRAHSLSDEGTSGHAAKCKARLRSMVRLTAGGPE